MDYQIQNTRYCQLKGHEENKTSYICIYKDGQQTQKWLCVDCILQYFDNNGHPQQNHKMKKKLFLEYIKQQSEPNYHQSMEKKKAIQICITGLKQFIQSTQSLIQQLMEDLIAIDKNYHIKEIEEIINFTEEKDHNLLKKSQIDELINLNNYNQKTYDYNLSSDLLKQLTQRYLDLKKLLENKNNNKQQYNILIKQEDNHLIKSMVLKDSRNQTDEVSKQTINQINDNVDVILKDKQYNDYKSNQIIDVKNRKYMIQQIDQSNNCYFGSSLSSNEKYLAYGGEDKIFKIYEIKLNKIIKEIKLDYRLNVCQFTQDSSQFYVGLDQGFVQGYDVQDDFKEIFKQQIHSNNILNLITIQNAYLITCSADESIIKTEIKSKQQIFKLNGHTERGQNDGIYAIDYNDKDEIIASALSQGITFWNCMNQSIIMSDKLSKSVRQLQFINNNQYILSLDRNCNLLKWKIDFRKQLLIKIQSFTDINCIFSFYQVNQNQSLLLICNDYVKIVNSQGETLKTIMHFDRKADYEVRDCRQLDNLNYIQIRAQKKIFLAIAQD